MVRSDGYVKVLDFGLAKRIPVSGALQTDSTVTLGPSVPGQILGTVAYMSPEQILGQEIDQRSDLFAFGIVCSFCRSSMSEVCFDLVLAAIG